MREHVPELEPRDEGRGQRLRTVSRPLLGDEQTCRGQPERVVRAPRSGSVVADTEAHAEMLFGPAKVDLDELVLAPAESDVVAKPAPSETLVQGTADHSALDLAYPLHGAVTET